MSSSRPSRKRTSVASFTYASMGETGKAKKLTQTATAKKNVSKKGSNASETKATKAKSKKGKVTTKRVLEPQNWDDDEEVEAYKEKVAERDEAKAAKTENQRTSGKSDDALTAGMIEAVEQIVTNLANGDCPLGQVHEAFVFCYEPDKLGNKGATRVLVTRKFGGAQASAGICCKAKYFSEVIATSIESKA